MSPLLKPAPVVPALVLVWSRAEPHRVGECTLLWRPKELRAAGSCDFVLGRTTGSAEGEALTFLRQRPGSSQVTGPLEASRISREQWRLRLGDHGGLEIENVGRRPLVHEGVSTKHTVARFGDLMEIAGEALFMLVLRPALVPASGLAPQMLSFPFGKADPFGIIGESPVIWHHRRQLAIAARRPDHVLLSGPSGAGKELAARSIHDLSARRSRPLIARNAATLPESIIDAELFGTAKDYPNSGAPERLGLIGAADGSTLFLDEIGEISHALQAHLLRVLDGGEYHRLGESRPRRADLRVVAASNRAADELKHDLLPRLTLRLTVPSLDQRREDIPLIARSLLRKLCLADPAMADLCFDEGNVAGEPRWDAHTIAALLRGRYDANVRDLQATLWQAAAALDGGPLSIAAEPARRDTPTVDPRTITLAQLQAALAQCGGSRERAWRALGLRNRHQIMRLLRRYEHELKNDSTLDE